MTASNKANPGAADAVYVQCYANLGNDPSEWNGYFQSTGLKVAPGLWATHFENVNGKQVCTNWTSAAQTQTQITSWAKLTTLDGGWMFCGTDMMNCTGGGTPADYAKAIAAGLSKTGVRSS